MPRLLLCLVLTLTLALALTKGDEPDRAAIRKKMERAMGPLPGPDRKVPLDAKVEGEEKLDGYVRRKVTFAAEKGDRVPAWLLIPNTATRDKKAPAMLCLHQTITIGKDEPVGLGKQDSKRRPSIWCNAGTSASPRTTPASASTSTTSRPRSSAATTSPAR